MLPEYPISIPLSDPLIPILTFAVKPRYSNNGEYERRRTPIHIVLSNEGKQRSIDLVPSSFEAPSILEENLSDTN